MSTAQPTLPWPLTVLVDDVRGFRDKRPALVARSSQEALHLLDELRDKRIADLWLDHDLAGEDTLRPVVELLVRLANEGTPQNVGQVHVHSSNVGAGHRMVVQLDSAGYSVVHSYALAMWTRAC
jgi:hypothetical protein